MNHTVTTKGDYELCFNNRFSAFTSKKILWEIDIIGDEQKISFIDEVKLAVNQTLEAYYKEAKQVISTIWILGISIIYDKLKY